MTDSGKPLDYASRIPAKPADLGNVLAWIALAFIVIQFIWLLPCALLEDHLFRNGLPKQPTADFILYMASVAPAVIAILLSFSQCLIKYIAAQGLRKKRVKHSGVWWPQHSKLAVFVGIVGLLFLGAAVYGWVNDDIINRSIPHPVWTVP